MGDVFESMIPATSFDVYSKILVINLEEIVVDTKLWCQNEDLERKVEPCK